MEKFRKEVMAFVKYEDHIKMHNEINEIFNVDCDNLPVDEHLKLHLELMYKKYNMSKEDYEKYDAEA